MLLGTMFHHGLSSLVILHEWVTALVYVSILADHLHPMVQNSFPHSQPVFQDDRSPIHTAGIVRDWHDD